MRTYAYGGGGMKMYGVQQGGGGGVKIGRFFAYVIYGWPLWAIYRQVMGTWQEDTAPLRFKRADAIGCSR